MPLWLQGGNIKQKLDWVCSQYSYGLAHKKNRHSKSDGHLF